MDVYIIDTIVRNSLSVKYLLLYVNVYFRRIVYPDISLKMSKFLLESLTTEMFLLTYSVKTPKRQPYILLISFLFSGFETVLGLLTRLVVVLLGLGSLG